MEWRHPDTITGGAATDGRYLRRKTINDQFWREVGKGNHILLVAPRRVGKTSMMKDLVESERHVYQFISPLLQQFWLTKYPAYA